VDLYLNLNSILTLKALQFHIRKKVENLNTMSFSYIKNEHTLKIAIKLSEETRLGPVDTCDGT